MEQIFHLPNTNSDACLVIGDINEIINSNEKSRKQKVTPLDMQIFTISFKVKTSLTHDLA